MRLAEHLLVTSSRRSARLGQATFRLPVVEVKTRRAPRTSTLQGCEGILYYMVRRTTRPCLTHDDFPPHTYDPPLFFPLLWAIIFFVCHIVSAPPPPPTPPRLLLLAVFGHYGHNNTRKKN